MDTDKLRKANELQDCIIRYEVEKKRLEEDLFSCRDLDEEYEDGVCFSSCEQEFRYRNQRIFIPKILIEERLGTALAVLMVRIEDLKKEFKEL